MSLKTCVSTIKIYEPGAAISYGRTYKTDRRSRVGVLPIGYADGFFRTFSNRFQVLTADGPALVLGRICMDMCMIDLTGCPNVGVGDEIEIFGVRNSVNAMARMAETILMKSSVPFSSVFRGCITAAVRWWTASSGSPNDTIRLGDTYADIGPRRNFSAGGIKFRPLWENDSTCSSHRCKAHAVSGRTGKRFFRRSVSVLDTNVKQGDIYYADLRPVVGSEQGRRPARADRAERHGQPLQPTVIAAAITSQVNKARLPTHIELSAQKVWTDQGFCGTLRADPHLG